MRDVEPQYYESTNAGGPAGDGFAKDVADAIDDAIAARDKAAPRRLRSLWFDYFEVDLPSLGAAKLIDYLESRQVWQVEGMWSVFKTVDVPCIAFAAQVSDAGSVTLMGLGACYRYPGGSEDAWWINVIRPRLRSL